MQSKKSRLFKIFLLSALFTFPYLIKPGREIFIPPLVMLGSGAGYLITKYQIWELERFTKLKENATFKVQREIYQNRAQCLKKVLFISGGITAVECVVGGLYMYAFARGIAGKSPVPQGIESLIKNITGKNK